MSMEAVSLKSFGQRKVIMIYCKKEEERDLIDKLRKIGIEVEVRRHNI